MNKNYFASLLFVLSASLCFAQSFNQFFADIDVKHNTTIGTPLTKAFSYRTISVNIPQLKSYLQNVPLEFTAQAASNANILQLPMPDGSIADFDMVESPMMEAGLAAQFPDIKTYSGHGITDKTAYLKISITPKGFHAMILSAAGTYFIDPYNYSNTNFGIVYDKQFFDANGRSFDCKVGGTSSTNTNFQSISQSVQGLGISTPTVQFGDCQRRNFRLALAATGEYTAFHGGTVALALAAQVVTVNRVNGVYEKEIGVHLNIVANNNLIIYTNASTDPFSNTNPNSLLTENQTTCDGIIGAASYDIGHVFSTGGGGLASTPCVCSSGFKAQAETGSAAPIGDAFDIDYVAHEMGHQFGGNHTFSANTGSCSGNANSGTAVEVGSGVTIMAYAGICAPKDVANNSIDNFHSTSLGEITSFLTSASASCRTLQTVTNNSPVISSSTGNKTIPKSTPFILTSTATDADGDVMTYNWEQYDNSTSATQPPVATNTTGPLFRPFSPNTSPTWYFPRIDSLANNTPLKWEILPSVARTMNFKLTVRDNHAGNGCTTSATNVVTVDGASGPFVVTSPTATGITYAGQSSQTVTWNVANTTAAPVSCANVDIFLSTDGGMTYPTQLASAQPNDGVQVVTIPNVATTTARIMVRGNGNIFFDISNNNFTITAASVPDYSIAAAPLTQTVCTGNNATYTITSQSILSYSQSVSLSTAGLPSGASASFSPNPITPGGTSTLTITGLNAASTSTITVIGTSTAGTRTANAALTVLQGVGATTVNTPAANATNVSTQPAFAWTATTGAVTYDLQIATNTGFTTGLQTFNAIATNSYTLTTGLAPNTLYYWRVRGVNTCNNGTYSTVRSFTTANIFCHTFTSTAVPVPISSTVAQTIFSQLSIPSSGVITDVNVVNLSGTHTYIQDLSFSLVSPTGTTVNLLTNICTNQQNFNINFDDASANIYTSIPCPPTGGLTYQPQNVLSALNGQEVNGIWQLNVDDNFPTDGGSLDSWGLNVCYTPNCNIVPTLATNIPNCPNINTASVVATLTGGLPPYTYAWTNTAQTTSTITGLSNNTYAVTITDAQGCTAASSATISNLPAPATVATTSPANAATVTSTTVNFTWSAAANAVTYQIDISTSSTFATIAYTANAITTTNHTATISGSGTYYWRVRGINSCANGTYSTTKNFTIPNITCTTFMSTDVVNKTIGPNAGTTTSSNLTIAGTGTIVDLNVVSLTGTHTYINDLIFSLKSPTNVIDTLIKNICGGDADFKIGFDDASTNLYSAIPCPATDSLMYNAYNLLSAYNGANANGQWQLSVTDIANGDGGTLNTWGLNVCYLPSVTCTMTASTTKTNATCPTSTDGTATANQASGGAGPFTYLWSNGQTTQTATALAAGTYTVVVTNAQGCTATATATITSTGTVPTALVTPNAAIITCTTTSVNLVATGGGTYLWNNYTTNASRTVTSAGTYSVVVTNAAGCTASASATVTSNITPPIAAITPNATELTCSNTSANLVASGGGTYMWNNNTTNAIRTVTSAGTYSVVVTGTNGCTASASTTIASNTAVPAALVTPNSATLTCSTTSVNLVASGGGTYLWNNNTTNATRTVTSAGTYSVVVTGANGCTASASATVTSNTTSPVAAVTPNVATITCLNPTVTLLASGGASYLWNNNIATSSNTVTSAGTYSVVVTGTNGCTALASVAVTANTTAPTAAIAQPTTELNCATTSITLTANGGVGYLWDNSTTNTNRVVIAAGTYTVVVANTNGCTATASVTITSNTTAPDATIAAQPNPVCVNTPVALSTANAGNGSLYTWLGNGITSINSNATMATPTAIGAQTYNVTIVGNNGCSAAGSTTIIVANTATWYQDLDGDGFGNAAASQVVCAQPTGYVGNSTDCNDNDAAVNATPAQPIITAQGPTTFCTGNSVVLVSSAQSGNTWSNSVQAQNITVTSSGIYSVTVANSCGSATSNIMTVVANSLPIPIISQTGNDLLVDSAIYTSYQWSLENSAIANATNATYTPTSNGNYTLQVTDANGCSATSNTLTVITVSVNEIANGGDIQVYPNPFSSSFTIKISSLKTEMVNMLVTDVIGQVIMNERLSTNASHKINFNDGSVDVAAGVYFIRINDIEGKTHVIKLIKN